MGEKRENDVKGPVGPDQLDRSELVEQTFDFWFAPQPHIRSPFPTYIHSDLRHTAVGRFHIWLTGLKAGSEKEIDRHIVGEKLEEIIFETALDLVKTEDEKITINYPFLPRLDDVVEGNQEGAGSRNRVIDRRIMREGDHSFLAVKYRELDSDRVHETKFELPL